MARCTATTKAGQPCRQNAVRGTEVCPAHTEGPITQLIPPTVCRCDAYKFPHDPGYGACSVDPATLPLRDPVPVQRDENGRKPRPKRPFDERQKSRFIEAIRAGGRRYASADDLGIGRATLHRHLRDDEEFRKAVELAEEAACEIVEDAMFRKAVDGDIRAGQWWLANRAPKRWMDTRQVQSVQVTGTVDHVIEPGQTMARILELQAKLEARAAQAALLPAVLDVDAFEPDED